MKKILITGKNSYVGRSLEKWLRNYPNSYLIDSINLRNDSWKEKDFSEYDVVFHVAGIAHIKETKENAHLYYKVNRDLAYEVAQKARIESVKQFIFLSSMSVYGIETGVIDKDSALNPKSNYGKSKLEAENLITNLEDSFFKVAILRPPMIYGKGCKGNYTKLAKLALKTPIFPDIDNERSMIYIDNLSEFVKCLIDNCSSGLFFPQNNDYVNTSKMVKLIAKKHGKKILLTELFNPLLTLMKRNETVSKVFGSLTYEETLSKNSNAQINSFVDFEESIRLTED
ncbi:NAD-dependent epimerase/dehydratase family protein [Cytobacillus firmus]|uniref:NAD-dependent epimerase/dehydratase family protein n=1 Tax=Cytobacillus firmus TaxID=1399 RepID=A0AA46SHQ0_CYTFI|nr:NAD-dependent epimerase/dehydratase family protein [Cytobacillus firmus]UYG93830.1 NAD-dependent epimerase/dehydratase family protein [Cytobacillus firmus]